MKNVLRQGVGFVALLATIAISTTTTSAQLREKWCSDVNIRFFAGGAAGDAYGTIVYNGARQAAEDLGANVDYLFSGWDRERMTQQLREAIAQRPHGIAMMGHPGDAVMMPLAEQATEAGIKMLIQTVDVPKVREQFGFGYVGTNFPVFGRKLGSVAIERLGLEAGDHALVFARWADEARSVREGAAAEALAEAGLEVKRIEVTTEMATDPNLLLPLVTAALVADPEVKLMAFGGGQLLGNVPTFLRAANKQPGEIKVIGFDTSAQVIEGFEGGWVQLAADQQPFLQGYLPILSLCQQVVFGLEPLSQDTGAGFVDASNYMIVAPLAKEGLR
jgi:simple sugar transport system substrate-binding protein